jgi:multiple sugar transport system permease protein
MTESMQKKKMPTGLKVSLVIQKVFIYTFLIAMSVMFLFWLYILIVNSTRQSAHIQQGFSITFGNYFTQNYNNMISDTNIRVFDALRNSLIIAFSSAALTTYFSAMTAYGIHLYHFKLRKAAFIFIMVVMIIPSQVATIGLLSILYQINFIDNYYVIIIPSIAAPAVFFFMKQYMDSVLPYEIIESARVDGASELRIFHQIALPMIKPALAVQFIFSFVASWNNFFFPAMVITSPSKRTIPMLIAELRQISNPANFDMGRTYMVICFAVVPLVIIYFIFSRYIIKGVTLGSIKG